MEVYEILALLKLLMSVDLTQETIAMMLGKQRNLISVATGILQKRKLIENNRRGRLTIIDRKGLEACECYLIITESIEARLKL